MFLAPPEYSDIQLSLDHADDHWNLQRTVAVDSLSWELKRDQQESIFNVYFLKAAPGKLQKAEGKAGSL